MTDTVFDGVQTRLTHHLSFLRLPLSSDSVALRLSLYLHPALTCQGSSQLSSPPTPPHTHLSWPYCFTSLHSGFYGRFVLARTHLPGE